MHEGQLLAQNSVEDANSATHAPGADHHLHQPDLRHGDRISSAAEEQRAVTDEVSPQHSGGQRMSRTSWRWMRTARAISLNNLKYFR